MKTILTTLFMLLGVLPLTAQTEHTSIQLFDEVTFYDGYLFENNPDADVQDGVLRHRTSLYAVRMTDEQLAQVGDSLFMKVYVKACCDNYDRIGNINLAFVPKGETTYDPFSVQRIELGRFITPFMNKNKQPDTVPYSYDISYVSYILRDVLLREQYDIWAEFELFGVPYAANEQVSGCAGRSDVFKGTLILETTTPSLPATTDDVLVPIVMKKPEDKGHNLNNYSEQGTDTIGKTTKTYTFDVPVDVADGQLVIVTSNHGSNSGGEEYNRRWHYIYVDDALMLTYKPGRQSCEPFRQYNTQPNGIYGRKARSDASWQSFSNWCPGDVIDNRIISLGAFAAGQHKVRISVPEAEFKGQQGDIHVSIFFQGLKNGELPTDIVAVKVSAAPEVTMHDGQLTATGGDVEIAEMELYDLQGNCLQRSTGYNPIQLGNRPAGIYLLNIEQANGVITTRKIVNR